MQACSTGSTVLKLKSLWQIQKENQPKSKLKTSIFMILGCWSLCNKIYSKLMKPDVSQMLPATTGNTESFFILHIHRVVFDLFLYMLDFQCAIKH